jgi:hypothetical protein
LKFRSVTLRVPRARKTREKGIILSSPKQGAKILNKSPSISYSGRIGAIQFVDIKPGSLLSTTGFAIEVAFQRNGVPLKPKKRQEIVVIALFQRKPALRAGRSKIKLGDLTKKQGLQRFQFPFSADLIRKDQPVRILFLTCKEGKSLLPGVVNGLIANGP